MTTVFEIYKKIAKGEWSMMDTEQFLTGYNRRGLTLLKVELIYMKHSLDPVQKKLLDEPGASNRFEAFEHRVDMLLEHKERVYLLGKEGLSDQTKKIIKAAPWLSKEGRLDLPLEEIPSRDLDLIAGRQPKPGRPVNKKGIKPRVIKYYRENKERLERENTEDGYVIQKRVAGQILDELNDELGIKKAYKDPIRSITGFIESDEKTRDS